MQGWGGSRRDGVGYAVVGYAGVGWGRHYGHPFSRHAAIQLFHCIFAPSSKRYYISRSSEYLTSVSFS